MSIRRIIPFLVVAAFALATPGLCLEITSLNHPSLTRALAENPKADRDQNGTLDLTEYTALHAAWKKGRPDKQNPASPCLAVRENGDIVVADFEDNNLRVLVQKGWTLTGDAFPNDLQTGTRMMKRRVGSFEGNNLLTTLAGSEGATGRLASMDFLLELDHLVVVMSGGKFPHRIAVNLLVDGDLVRSATGSNDDYFEKVVFEVGEFVGRPARIELVDSHRGLWGHLNVDRIFMTAEAGEGRIISAPPAPPPARGLVLTTSGPRRGELEIRDSALRVAGEALAAHDLLLAVAPREPARKGIRSALRLRNGETWNAEIRGLETGQVAIHSNLFGERQVALDQIASLEFEPAAHGAERLPGQLYRAGGDPIPGKLVWVRPKDIAIDCALGVIPIPRESVQRFVLADSAPDGTPQHDEIGLADGSRLFGQVSFADDKLVITHALLGELRLDWTAIRFLRRASAGTTWLDHCPRTIEESWGPALPPPAPEVLEDGDGSQLRSLRIMPHTVLRFDLPTGPGRRILRSNLAPIAGCQVPMVVRFRCDETIIAEETISPGAAPLSLSLDLPEPGTLTIEVDFAGPLGFPSAIELRDAHVLTVESNPQPGGQN